MGQSISSSTFTPEDFVCYEERVRTETQILSEWFRDHAFMDGTARCGFELEAWLVGHDLRPAPRNVDFLTRLDDPLVVMELSKFNVELNAPPAPLRGAALSEMLTHLESIWARCREAARGLELDMMLCGILPSALERDFTAATMSPQKRFHALNEQVLKLRGDEAIPLDIRGRDHFAAEHHDLMLEAAATSFQVHLQVPAVDSVRAFNAAVALSGPLVAVTANSPFLFGRDLWSETRIPLFEQAVATRSRTKTGFHRVTLGRGYAHQSLLECFTENIGHYPVLLPELSDEPTEKLPHLRLLNGTIWRWNRPLIGFDESGVPHLRLEHRVMPAGPSLVDSVVNAALFFGLIHAFTHTETAIESRIPFEQTRDNFYAGARDGLAAEFSWPDVGLISAPRLWLEILLPLARQGLEALSINPTDIACFLDVAERRMITGQNGAAWQRAFVAKYGPDMGALTRAYFEHQCSGEPVHEWDI